MNPDAAHAIPKLVEAGSLPPEQAPFLLRVARRELVSVHWELRALLYLGVLLITGGVGLLIQQNLDRIGPAVIAVTLGLAAAAALAWVQKVAPPFSWGEVKAPNLVFDYILLLGVLLAASDLAYIEVQFTPLGAAWSWHLLIVSLFAALAAFRYDSPIVFTLALSTFAAWRGVSVARFGIDTLWGSDSLRWNALGCGLLFAALGFLLKKTGRKAHFEPVAVQLGWLLTLWILGLMMFEDDSPAWGLVLLATGLALAVGAYRVRRFPLFAYGVLAAYAALTMLAFRGIGDEGAVLGCFWFTSTPIVVIAGLILAQRRLREPA